MRPLVGESQAVKQADERAFAGTAVADDAVNLPGLYRQTDVVYRHDAALCAVKVLQTFEERS